MTSLTSSLKPMCIPQSNMMFLPPRDSNIQLRPTSAMKTVHIEIKNICKSVIEELQLDWQIELLLWHDLKVLNLNKTQKLSLYLSLYLNY